MHVVLGDGEMTRKELTETMADLWKADEEAEASFWFLLQGKSDPTATDTALVKWLDTNGIYYEVVTDDAEGMSGIYEQAQETHTAKKLSAKVVQLLNSKPEEGEEAELLALFFSDDSSAEEDRWLNEACQQVFDAGITVRALNDGLLEVDLSEAAAEAEAEPEETTAKVVPIKSAAKKAVAKKGGAAPRRTPVSEEEEVPEDPAARVYTREELGDMELPALKEIAAAKGITFPPRTRMTTYIDAILGEDVATAEVSEPSETSDADNVYSTNGFDVEALADAIVMNIVKRLEAALS
jgi:hypothetical protein